MAALDDVVSVSDTEPFIKMLLYGPPGVGKTTFCAGAPKPLFIDFERSTETLRFTSGAESTAKIVPRDVAHLRQIMKELPESEYETVIIDTLSQFQDSQLQEFMVKKFSKTDDKRLLPLFQDFRISTELIKEICRDLQEMDINVVIIAHDRHLTEKTDAGTERVWAIRPEMTPRVGDSIRRLVNIVAYMQKSRDIKTKTVSRHLYVNESGKILAKNRLNIQDEYLVNPSWKTLAERK